MAKSEFVSNRYYNHRGQEHRPCLEVADFDLENGGAIQLWDNAEGESQQWKILDAGDGFHS